MTPLISATLRTAGVVFVVSIIFIFVKILQQSDSADAIGGDNTTADALSPQSFLIALMSPSSPSSNFTVYDGRTPTNNYSTTYQQH